MSPLMTRGRREDVKGGERREDGRRGGGRRESILNCFMTP